MTTEELVERSYKALEKFHNLPYEEQWRQLIAWGIINEKGEVLWGEDPDEEQQKQEKPGTANGSPAEQSSPR